MSGDAGPAPAAWAVRDATAADAGACAAVYAPFVTDTAVSFETEPPDAAAMADRIAAAQAAHAWLVLVRADEPGRALGYAYGGPFRARPAYRFSCEVSVYLAPGARGHGGGRLLYAALLERLAGLGYRTAVGGMTLPNEASAGLHAALGFTPVGVFRSVGFKAGRWHDVAFVQRALDNRGGGPGDPGAADRRG